MLAAAMHGLHLERFVKDLDIPLTFFAELEDFNAKLLQDSKIESVIPDSIALVLTQYDLYTHEKLAGKMGKTAQFWMMYTRFADLFLILQRALKSNDVNLYGYVLCEICAIFFSTNKHNYSRWMLYFALELCNLKNVKPDVYTALTNGGFSVRRTENPFSQVGVDMCLEQTINSQSKNRLKGIMQFADVSSAVNRWLLTNSMKVKLVNLLLEKADMHHVTEIGKEARPCSVKRDQGSLLQLKTAIVETLNPFDRNLPQDKLFNIKTGRQASDKVEKFLLQITQNGEEKRDAFVGECQSDPERFERAVSKVQIHNFASENFSKKNTSRKAAEIVEVKGTRDLFGRLLYLAITHGIDLAKSSAVPNSS